MWATSLTQAQLHSVYSLTLGGGHKCVRCWQALGATVVFCVVCALIVSSASKRPEQRKGFCTAAFAVFGSVAG